MCVLEGREGMVNSYSNDHILPSSSSYFILADYNPKNIQHTYYGTTKNQIPLVLTFQYQKYVDDGKP